MKCKYTKMYNKNISEKFFDHCLSAHVVLEHVEHKSGECYPSVNNKSHDSENDSNFIKIHKCKECEKKFVHKSTLDAHAVVHEPFPHVCDCGIGFFAKQDLCRHKSLVHSSEIKQQLQKLTSRRQRALINEIWTPDNIIKEVKKNTKDDKVPSEKLETDAKINGAKKTSKQNKLGAKSAKTKKTGEKCSEKNENFSQKYKVDDSRTPFRCNLCGKRFSQSGSLKIHFKRHAGIKEYKCSFCGKEFVDVGNLQNHERTHTGLKPYVCAYCPKSFSDKSAHTRHERTHTGYKPYVCKYCGMKFSDASGRLVHEKRHTNERNHKCDICEKQFYASGDLSLHKTISHSKEKKYQCDICSKTFAVKYYLVIHMKTHFNQPKTKSKPVKRDNNK